MPIFEYQCRHCQRRTEKIQAKPLDKISCPGCGEKASRIVSLTSFSATDNAGCSAPAGSGFT